MVTDPVSHARITEVIITSKNTLEQAKKTVSALEKTRQIITKVSNTVKQLELVTRTAHSQQVTIQRAEDAISFVKKSGQFSPAEINMIVYNFTNVITATNRTIALITSITQDGFFKMNDSERLQLLLDMNRRVSAGLHDVNRMFDNYNKIAGKRNMFSVFN